MEKSIITSGKTIDLAIESALSQLGLDRDSVSVTVLQQAKSGFLGFGAQSAKVQVTYEVPDPVPEKEEKPKSALGSASRSKPKAPAAPVKKPEAPQPPKAEPPKPAPQPAPTPAPAKRPEPPKQDRPRPPKPPRPEKPKVPAAPKTYAPAEPGSVEEKIEVFIKGLLEHMDSNAVPHCWKDEGNTYKVDLVGDDLGYLIGRRGDTLDAIQHLTNYTINRDVEGHIRVNVDAAVLPGEAGGESAPLRPEEGAAGAESPPPHHSGAHERLRAPRDPRGSSGHGEHHHPLHRRRTQPPRGDRVREISGYIAAKCGMAFTMPRFCEKTLRLSRISG